MEKEKKNLETTSEDEFENGKGNDTPEDATIPEPPTTEAA